MDDFAFLDATAQADLVRRKQVKPIELVDAAIERIERLNPALNAVVTPMYDIARGAASGPPLDGPFAGVPFLLKDLSAAYAGVRLTSGSAFLKDYVPAYDSELVARYKRAGLVTLGKTNTPEFGLVPTAESVLLGPARNPWDTGRTTGGSSGGSAAAVAAGMVAAAHGGDGGGSIRIPASCCGVVGLKPTRGRNPLGPEVGDVLNGLVAPHVLTRSVRDCAALLDATSGAPVPAGDGRRAGPPADRLRHGVADRHAGAPGLRGRRQGRRRAVRGAGTRGGRAQPRHQRTDDFPDVHHRLVGGGRAVRGRDGGAHAPYADSGAVRAAYLGAGPDGPREQRPDVPDRGGALPDDVPPDRPLHGGPRRVAYADRGRAAASPGNPRRASGQPDAGVHAGGAVRAVHAHLQRHRPARDLPAAVLELRRASPGHALRRPLRRRGDPVPPGGPAGAGAPLGRPPPAGLGGGVRLDPGRAQS